MRFRAALSGVVAAVVALGFGELLAGVFDGVPSLVEAVAGGVVDLAPPFLKDFAVSALGTADKPVLVVGIVVVVVAAGALLGSASTVSIGSAGFALVAAIGALAASSEGSPAGAWINAAAMTAAAAGTLAMLKRKQAEPLEGRRDFLRMAGAFAAAGGLAAFAGRSMLQAAATAGARLGLTLPAPVEAAGPQPASLDLPGLTSLYVPNESFYRVDTAFTPPSVNVDGWSLRVTGLVDEPLELTYEDLLAMPMVERDVTLACVSNGVGGRYVGNARWLGVPLADLLDRAGLQRGATQIVGRSVDDFTVGFPSSVAFDGRTAMVAVGMNGEPLPAAHGFPARLVVAGLYGYVSATKWLAEIELTTWEAFDAYWIPRGWAKEAPIKLQSRIDVPRKNQEVGVGLVPVAGVAWAPPVGIGGVEVKIDDGPWVAAELGPSAGSESWRQWRYLWEASAGSHVLSVRATDADGTVQPAERRPPRPNGATGHHSIRVFVQEA